MRVSLVVPAYNEEKNIEHLVRRCSDALTQITTDFEIIVVDDGSRDETPQILERLRREFDCLLVVRLRERAGQHLATAIGLDAADGEYVVLVDADMHVPPEEIGRLFEAAQEQDEWDIISGARPRNAGQAHRSVGSRMVGGLLNRMASTQLDDPTSTFRLFTRRAVERICGFEAQSQNFQILVGLLGMRIVEVTVAENDVSSRKSHYSLLDLLHVLALALLNYSGRARTVMVLVVLGVCLFLLGSAGVLTQILIGISARVPLQTNYLVFFLFLGVSGLQFVLMGIVAYKIERISLNLRFRREKELLYK
jgi:glycosyltransferase involved in cell wall biosynthesis